MSQFIWLVMGNLMYCFHLKFIWVSTKRNQQAIVTRRRIVCICVRVCVYVCVHNIYLVHFLRMRKRVSQMFYALFNFPFHLPYCMHSEELPIAYTMDRCSKECTERDREWRR